MNSTKRPRVWATGGEPAQAPAASPAASSTSDAPPSVSDSESCLDKAGFARYLHISIRSLDRAAAAGAILVPDAWCGRLAPVASILGRKMDARQAAATRQGMAPMTISPPDAWALRRLLTGQSLNGELDALAEPWKTMGEYLAPLPKQACQGAWQAMLVARPERRRAGQGPRANRPDSPATASPASHIRDGRRCSQGHGEHSLAVGGMDSDLWHRGYRQP